VRDCAAGHPRLRTPWARFRAAAAALAVVLLAAPDARAEGPPPREAGGVGAVLFAADPRGGRESRGAFGLRAGLALPLLPRPWFLAADALWLHARWEEGTEAVRVTTAVDTFALPLAAGLAWRPTDGVWLSPYLAAGPTLVRTGLKYRVADPLAPAALRNDLADYAPGAIYGAGTRLALAVGPDLAISLRVEALGLRRGVADDLALAGSLGLLF
jgi:hypothetical protein